MEERTGSASEKCDLLGIVDCSSIKARCIELSIKG